jgi:hypothetical protein
MVVLLMFAVPVALLMSPVIAIMYLTRRRVADDPRVADDAFSIAGGP